MVRKSNDQRSRHSYHRHRTNRRRFNQNQHQRRPMPMERRNKLCGLLQNQRNNAQEPTIHPQTSTQQLQPTITIADQPYDFTVANEGLTIQSGTSMASLHSHTKQRNAIRPAEPLRIVVSTTQGACSWKPLHKLHFKTTFSRYKNRLFFLIFEGLHRREGRICSSGCNPEITLYVGVTVLSLPHDCLREKCYFDPALLLYVGLDVANAIFSTCPAWLHVGGTARLWM